MVLPDGCRDLILHVLPTQRPVWFVTELAERRYDVPGTVGARYWGFRLRPGVQVDEKRLLAALQSQGLHDPQEAVPLLEDCTHTDRRVDDALRSLSVHASVAGAAQQLGVSERTLQRWVQAATGREPAFWKCLARVRRAAAALSLAPSLAACAADHGFTDQAHMTREFRRWLGCTPGAALASSAFLATVAESGY